MVDPLLLPLAEASDGCYSADVKFAWQGEDKTSHLLHTVSDDGVHEFVWAGTMDGKEWALDLFAVPMPVPNFPQVGDLHAGFLIGTLASIDQYIVPTMKSLGWPPFRLAGHSKGAAQAGQAHGILKVLGHRPVATRMYEPPLFGGEMLAGLMLGDDVVWTQTYNTHGPDVITQVPVGPSWRRHKDPVHLPVPDTMGVADKHKTVGVLAGIKALSA